MHSDTQRHRQTYTVTYIQTDREYQRHTDTYRNIQDTYRQGRYPHTDSQTDNYIQTDTFCTERHTDRNREKNSLANIKSNRKTDRAHRDGQSDRSNETYIHIQPDGQTHEYRQTGRHIRTHTYRQYAYKQTNRHRHALTE